MLHSQVMQSAEPPIQVDPHANDSAAPTEPPEILTNVNGAESRSLGAGPFVEAWDDYAAAHVVAGARGRRAHNLRVTREIVETAIFALFMFLAVRTVVQNFRVEGMSMDPTYHTGQYLLVNKMLYSRINVKAVSDWIPFWQSDDEAHYIFHGPQRGDVVVFEPPIPNRGDRDFIKRVIGLPGDHVVVKDDHVVINGQQLEESYIPGVKSTCFGQWCDVTLGDDQYFVMGDNRSNSSYSRFWGPVTGDKIIGKSWLIYLPFRDFGVAPNDSPPLVTVSESVP